MSGILGCTALVKNDVHLMSEETVFAFLQAEQGGGASEDTLRRRKRAINALYDWLPEDKTITKALLQAWRQAMQMEGYSEETILNFVKSINRYLGHVGRPDLRFKQGKAKDLSGQQFGYLTAQEPTGKKYRKDLVWHCICKCGNEIDLPATRLLTGHTLSCGCMLAEHLQKTNMYIAGTSIRQALADNPRSSRAKSGFTGITEKNGKWRAQISYKGQYYYLGSYSKLEDAVKARARAKELVQEDAMELLLLYQKMHNSSCENGERKALNILP